MHLVNLVLAQNRSRLYILTHGDAQGEAGMESKKMTKQEATQIKRLKSAINQWKEILDKQMNMSADLRNQERAIEAFTFILKLEAEREEIEVYGL